MTFDWPATLQLVVVAALIVAGGFAYLTYAGRKLDREEKHPRAAR